MQSRTRISANLGSYVVVAAVVAVVVTTVAVVVAVVVAAVAVRGDAFRKKSSF